MKIILVGPPGVGKGSQAELLKKHYQVTHISTGDMFRENLKNDTELGKLARTYMDKGELVPDSVTNKMVEERLSRPDCKEGFMLDGYPRNKEQAVALDGYLKNLGYKLDAVLLLVADDNILINRITGRRVCPKCKSVFHIETKKPKVDGICDNCGEKLIHRADDEVQVIKNRLEIYHKVEKQLIDYYDKQGLIIRIDGSTPIQEGFSQICEKLGELK